MAEPEPDADEFLRRACLTYADDESDNWAQAAQLLAQSPDLGRTNIHTAAVVADTDAVSRILRDDHGAANRSGGPFGWTPLLYLAYARHDPDISRADVLATARVLLHAGADPNASFQCAGGPTPFTVLTGVFGSGERGSHTQPPHPHSAALGRLLLSAGADPNDEQALYNRMFGPDDDHLELLFEYGLDASSSLVRGQLRWALTHGMTERVRLLVAHGADVVTPFADGRTPAAVAVTTGHPELLAVLGVVDVDLDPADRFVAAALAADSAGLADLEQLHPGITDAVRAARPGLIVWAAVAGRPGAIEMLAEAGFDVSARARSDIPHNDPWETALHHAAQTGDVEQARTLLRLGADPNARDQRFDGTPLDWARHFDQPALAALLEPLTAEREPDS